MVRVLYIVDRMENLTDAIILTIAFFFGLAVSELGSIVLLVLSIFLVLVKIKREIQTHHFNKLWPAIRSLFRRKNKYGE